MQKRLRNFFSKAKIKRPFIVLHLSGLPAFDFNFFAGHAEGDDAAVENEFKLVGIDLGYRCKIVEGREAAAFQFFVDENKSVAIEKHCFAGLAVFGDEEKEGTGEQIQVHFLDDDEGKGVVSLPHVHMGRVEKNGVLRVKEHKIILPPVPKSKNNGAET